MSKQEIESLIEFRKQYLDTITRMKCIKRTLYRAFY